MLKNDWTNKTHELWRLWEKLDQHAICHGLYSNFTANTFKLFQDFKTGEQVLQTVKQADNFVVLVKEEMVLQETTDRFIEIKKCCGIEMNLEND